MSSPETPEDKPAAKSHRPADGAEQWAALASASLKDGDTLASLARQTLDGPSIAALYSDRPNQTGAKARVNRQVNPEANPEANRQIDNRVLVRTGETDARRQQILDALEGGATSLELPVTDAGESLQALLTDVYLDMAGVSLQAGADAVDAANALMAGWDARDIAASAAIGEFNADPFAHLARHGQLKGGVAPAMKQMVQLANETASRYPQVTTAAVDMSLQHNAGASPRLELIAGIDTASRYLEALLDSGLAPQSCARQLVFRVAVDSDFLMNVVKIRSLRRLWLHVLQHLQITDVPVRIVAVTSTREHSTREPWMNHLRHVAASMAAVVGGVDSLIVLPHDRVDGQLLSDDGVLGDRMARNVALVLQEESWMRSVHDPMAGAHAAEHLTDALCAEVWQGLRDMQEEGGYLQALNSGSWQQAVAAVQAQRVRAMESGDRIMVGVNRFVADDQLADRPTAGSGKEPVVDSTATPGINRLEPQRDALAFGS